MPWSSPFTVAKILRKIVGMVVLPPQQLCTIPKPLHATVCTCAPSASPMSGAQDASWASPWSAAISEWYSHSLQKPAVMESPRNSKRRTDSGGSGVRDAPPAPFCRMHVSRPAPASACPLGVVVPWVAVLVKTTTRVQRGALKLSSSDSPTSGENAAAGSQAITHNLET